MTVTLMRNDYCLCVADYDKWITDVEITDNSEFCKRVLTNDLSKYQEITNEAKEDIEKEREERLGRGMA